MGGVITATKAVGSIYFLDDKGQEVLEASMDIEVKIGQDFGGIALKDAINEARGYAIGALKIKVEQKRRGYDCFLVPKNVHVDYTIKYGFENEEKLVREQSYKKGEQILKKGDYGKEIFWIVEGKVDIDGVAYEKGCIFGRAAFGNGIRTKDAFAKTNVKVLIINISHPDVINKLNLILEKFADEETRIRKVRPKARLQKIELDD